MGFDTQFSNDFYSEIYDLQSFIRLEGNVYSRKICVVFVLVSV